MVARRIARAHGRTIDRPGQVAHRLQLSFGTTQENRAADEIVHDIWPCEFGEIIPDETYIDKRYIFTIIVCVGTLIVKFT